jgi:hypothetical protein
MTLFGSLIATKESSFTETKQVCFNQVCATNNARILVICCYRAPDSSSKWLISFKKFLDYIMDTYEKIIMTGDFNFNLWKHGYPNRWIGEIFLQHLIRPLVKSIDLRSNKRN